ncbi:MAG: ribonuclease R [Eubacteriales bacterium]|nr:ribonuclease R [Eubacteriales bacterium]
MELKEKIREYISNRRYVPLKFDELYDVFSPEASLAEFSDAVAQLGDDGLLIYLKKGKIASSEAAGYLRGTFRSNAKGFGFFMPDEQFRRRTGGDLYIAPENTLDAVNDDEVLAVMTREARTGDKRGSEGRIVKITEHRLKTVIGTLRTLPRDTRCYIKPDDRHLNFTVLIEDAGSVKPGTKVGAEITDYPTATLPAKGRITKEFGESDSSEANYAAILHENGIKTVFDAETVREAEKVAAMPVSAKGRYDLRDRTIITMDGADAKDLDDAVSAERTKTGFILGVHIADVSHYVRAGTALDGEAMERGTSIYFADRVVPMLPEVISNGCCSLNAGTDKYTLSAFVELDSEGEITGCDLKETIIRSSVRGVYSEINDILEKNTDSEFYDKYKPVHNGLLDDMTALYNILDEKSRRRGALEIETFESKIILEDGKPVDIVKRDRGLSERYIEQFMLCANEAVANWLFWQDMPCVYRVHERPSPEKMQVFAVFAHNMGLDTTALKSKNIHSKSLAGMIRQANEADIGNTVSYVLLRSLMKAKYSSVAAPHFGLAIDKYCHFTSPIRRYPDLATHRIIKSVLRGEAKGTYLNTLTEFAGRAAALSTENELKAIGAEREIEDLYKTIYMLEHVGEIFDGIITSVAPFGLFVELPNTCEGLVPIATLDGYFNYNEEQMTLSCGYTVYNLGKKVRVLIESADVISRRVNMRIITDEQLINT